jgi:uncharacterized membrane protein SpoIIM required for sporulation
MKMWILLVCVFIASAVSLWFCSTVIDPQPVEQVAIEYTLDAN